MTAGSPEADAPAAAAPPRTGPAPIDPPGEVAALRAEVAALRAEVAALHDRLDAPVAAAGAGRFAALYQAFEDRFRGSEDEVRERLSIYLPDLARVTGGRGVLDVGPGRGEWLAMLAERGIPAYGVETNAALVAHLRSSRDLDVVEGDAVEHLRGLDPGSLDAVTAFHVVEHLELETLLALLAAARRALRPGGLLVLETPDPTNLVMGACNFYLDPTHRRPLPPALIEFLVHASGFPAVEIRPLHPKEDVDLRGLRLDGVTDGAAALLARAAGKAFFGPQDYAVLAVAGPAHADGSSLTRRSTPPTG